jgi:hypothetical protein
MFFVHKQVMDVLRGRDIASRVINQVDFGCPCRKLNPSISTMHCSENWR